MVMFTFHILHNIDGMQYSHALNLNVATKWNVTEIYHIGMQNTLGLSLKNSKLWLLFFWPLFSNSELVQIWHNYELLLKKVATFDQLGISVPHGSLVRWFVTCPRGTQWHDTPCMCIRKGRNENQSTYFGLLFAAAEQLKQSSCLSVRPYVGTSVRRYVRTSLRSFVTFANKFRTVHAIDMKLSTHVRSSRISNEFESGRRHTTLTAAILIFLTNWFHSYVCVLERGDRFETNFHVLPLWPHLAAI